MDFGVTLLLWIHLISIAVGGAAVFGIPVVGARMTNASPTARPDLFAAMMILLRLGRGALASLWITGLLIALLKFGGLQGLGPWFTAKIGLVILFTAIVLVSTQIGKRAAAGNAAATKRATWLGQISFAAFLAILLCAVLTLG